MTIDTTNLCSHLQKKLFEPEGVYYPIWQAMQNDEELTAVVRSRQLHIYKINFEQLLKYMSIKKNGIYWKGIKRRIGKFFEKVHECILIFTDWLG